MQINKRDKVLLLTIVHPDFLPPVYAAAQTLRDENYDVHILTFDSFVPSDFNLGSNITLETLGQHHNVSFMKRWQLRRGLIARAKEIVKTEPVAILSFCHYSFRYALKVKKNMPVVYHALEMADFMPKLLLRSPFTTISSLRALLSVHKADLAATPSVQRSAWLAGRCHLEQSPVTILNTSYLTEEHANPINIFDNIVPPHFRDKKIVLYTGAVNDRLCVLELVKAFDILNDEHAALVITGIKDNAYCREITEFVKNSASNKRIRLLPYVTREEMLALQSNSHIGMCLSKEYKNDLESQMIAPNKVGEYLAKGLFLVGLKSEYMAPIEMKGIASLSESPDPSDISKALSKALTEVENINYKTTIKSFVKDYFCMQKQLSPVITFLKNKA